MTIKGELGDMNNKNQRTVKLKHALVLPREKIAETHVFTISFQSYDKGPLPKAENFGITDPDKIEKFKQITKKLVSYDEPFFQWLEADAKNTILFADDPLSALKSAFPELAAELIAGV
jgi:hypothetical protein